MTRKGILIGVLCLALSSVSSIASALDLKAKFYSFPGASGAFGSFVKLDATGKVVNAVTTPLVMRGTLHLDVPVPLVDTTVVPNELAFSHEAVLSGTLDLFFPCNAASDACVDTVDHPFAGDLGINATYPIVSTNGAFEAQNVTFKTSPLVPVGFDPSKDRVLFSQDAAALSTITVTFPNLRVFTLKFGKISMFYNPANGRLNTNPDKGIQANYTLVDYTGAVVDQGKAFFFK